jgi:hypothetical protein
MNNYSKALRQPPSDIKPKDTTKQIEILRKALRKEDGMVGAPTNNAGGGEVAGIGVGAKGEPGVGKRKKPMPFKSFFKRKDPTY